MQDTDKPVDIDTSGPGAEVELDSAKEELIEETAVEEKNQETDKTYENERETKLEDGGSADDTVAKSDEPTDVQVNEEKTEKKKELEEYSEGVKRRIAKLTKPTGWRLLVLPFKMPEKTKGGLYLGQDTLERQQVASTCGLVLEMGPHCYDKEKFPEGPWCKKGNWVVFARYAGSRIQIDGGEVRLLNDDEVLATIDNPEDIFHQY